MPKLKRTLTLTDAIFSGMGVILGAGIYALIGGATSLTGNSVWLSFTVAAFVASLTGLSYAELSTLFPQSAAEYTYVRNSLGSHLVGFLVGWLELFADIVGITTVSLAFGGYLSSMFGGSMLLFAICLIVVVAFINFLGIKESSRMNVIFTIIEALGLLVIIIIGVNYFGSVNYLEFPHGFTGFFKAVGIVFFAYLGFEEIANIGEEVKNPKKNLPRAIVISVVLSTLVYALVALSVVSVVEWNLIGESKAPLSLVTSHAIGPVGSVVMSFIALFATSNTVLIFLLVGSRMMYGMSKGKSLPKIFSKVHKKTKTPYVSIFAVMVVSILFVLVGNIITVASMVDFLVFLIFVFVNLSLIVLRYKRPDLKRKFRVPLNIGKFPVISFLGLISSFFMLFHFEIEILLIVLSMGLLGWIVYMLGEKKWAR